MPLPATRVFLNSHEIVREMRIRWYGHMHRMEETNEVRAVGDIRVPRKRPRGDQEGDGWMASEGICRHCGLHRRMRRTEHSGNKEFGPLTPPSGKRRSRRTEFTEDRKRRMFLLIYLNTEALKQCIYIINIWRTLVK